MGRIRKFKKPTLGPHERAANRRYNLATYRARLREKGYRYLQKSVPEAIRQELSDYMDQKIKEYEESINPDKK